jgi:WD40 repeat protein
LSQSSAKVPLKTELDKKVLENIKERFEMMKAAGSININQKENTANIKTSTRVQPETIQPTTQVKPASKPSVFGCTLLANNINQQLPPPAPARSTLTSKPPAQSTSRTSIFTRASTLTSRNVSASPAKLKTQAVDSPPYTFLKSTLCHETAVTDVDVFAAEKNFITSSLDSTLKVWDIEYSKIICNYTDTQVVSKIIVNRKNDLTYSLTPSCVKVWDFRLPNPLLGTTK